MESYVFAIPLNKLAPFVRGGTRPGDLCIWIEGQIMCFYGCTPDNIGPQVAPSWNKMNFDGAAPSPWTRKENYK